MTKKELEAMVSGVKSPPLDRKQTRKLFEENANIDLQKGSSNEVAQRYAEPVAQEVAQRYAEPVAQEVAQRYAEPVAQEVAQYYTKPVAQEVAQSLWVAQVAPKKVAQSHNKQVAQNRLQAVAQNKPKQVAQSKPKQVAQSNGDELTKELSVLRYVGELKDRMKAIIGIEERKKFANNIGWGIMGEKRGKQYFLFAGKKLNGKKRKLYIGNAKK